MKIKESTHSARISEAQGLDGDANHPLLDLQFDHSVNGRGHGAAGRWGTQCACVYVSASEYIHERVLAA